MNAETAYLDIETSWAGKITVVGVYRPTLGTSQLVAPQVEAAALYRLLDGVERVVTYNGSRFDLPVIKRQLAADLGARFQHTDLMYHCWKHRLKGGLKKVEVALSIHRGTEGIDGLEAMRLWEAHRQGSKDALETLLHYNREDIENLEIIERRLVAMDAALKEATDAR